MVQQPLQRKFYHNANLPVVVPKVDVIFEDLIIAVAIGFIGLSVSSLVGYVSTFFSVLALLAGMLTTVWLLWFARKKRREELEQRGVCRAGVLRRHIAYNIGSDYLRGR